MTEAEWMTLKLGAAFSAKKTSTQQNVMILTNPVSSRFVGKQEVIRFLPVCP
jgi:hypothetical protein